jgi:hypothetical protein
MRQQMAERRVALAKLRETAPPPKDFGFWRPDPDGMTSPFVKVEVSPQFNPTGEEIPHALADKMHDKPLDPKMEELVGGASKVRDQTVEGSTATGEIRHTTPKLVEEMNKYNMVAIYIWIAAGILCFLSIYLGHYVMATLFGFVSFGAFFFTPK